MTAEQKQTAIDHIHATNRRIWPEEVAIPVEALGCQTWEDAIQLARDAGFPAPYAVQDPFGDILILGGAH